MGVIADKVDGVLDCPFPFRASKPAPLEVVKHSPVEYALTKDGAGRPLDPRSFDHHSATNFEEDSMPLPQPKRRSPPPDEQFG